jgi:hypothetical protein
MADAPASSGDSTSVSGVDVAATKAPPVGGIKTFKPQISVILAKNIGRSTVGGSIGVSQRYAGVDRAFDLTPYLGDAGLVMTSRSTRQAAGMWSVTFGDQMEPTQQDSLYALIEPLDIVTIRMARDGSKYGGSSAAALPIIMRGFVTSVRRETAMTAQGPRRVVVLNGQDYGKILQIMQIIYLPNYIVGQNLLTPYNLLINYGVGLNSDGSLKQDVDSFIQSILDKVVTPFLQQMSAASGYSGPQQSPVQEIILDSQVTAGLINPLGAQNFNGGSVYDLMKYFSDVGPWNELYIEDRPNAPYLVLRPNPFKDLSGNMIQGGTSPPSHDIRDEEIVEFSVSRTDSNVANYFWVGAPRMDIMDPSLLQLAANGQTPPPFVTDYPNCSPNLYGIRLLKLDTQEGPRYDGQSKDAVSAGNQTQIDFINARRDTLIKSNRDNIVLEEGQCTIRGNEAIVAGDYINRVPGPSQKGSGLEAEYYAHTVSHQFQPMRSFTTTITFDRGMGFARRIQENAGVSSPYLAETNLSGSYNDG